MFHAGRSFSASNFLVVSVNYQIRNNHFKKTRVLHYIIYIFLINLFININVSIFSSHSDVNHSHTLTNKE